MSGRDTRIVRVTTPLDRNWLCCERNTHGRVTFIREKRNSAPKAAPAPDNFAIDFELLRTKEQPVKNIVEW